MFDFEYHLKNLPDKPGVYLMKNSLGEVIYVGKAKILKNRVKSYFQNSKNHSEKVRVMVRNIAEFEYIVTDSEMEALILECNLIKKYREEKGLEKIEVSRLLQLHAVYLDSTELKRIEDGTQIVKDFELIGLCKVLDVNYDDLKNCIE